MEYSFCVSLPLLHRNLAPDTDFPDMLRICPGLPEAEEEGYLHCSWPLTPQTASAVLRDVRQLSASGIEAEQLRIRQQQEEAQARMTAEDRELRQRLGAAPSLHDIEAADRLRAQQGLLTTWALEEHMLEVETLTRKVNEQTLQLQSLLEQTESEPDPAFQSTPPAVQNLPWRATIAAASLFIPDNCAIALPASLWNELAESGIQPVPLPMGTAPLAAKGLPGGLFPGWQVVGSRPDTSKPWLLRPRLWLHLPNKV